MRKAVFTLAAAGTLALLGGCKAEPVDLGLYCEGDAATTVAFASNLAYGVEVPPPQVEGVHVLTEADLFQVPIGDPEALGLIASDASGTLHHRACKGTLCSVADAEAALGACSDQPRCRIIGAVKLSTFYPLYLSDEAGGHVCNPRWGVSP